MDIESCPAFSALKDDISDDPKKDTGQMTSFVRYWALWMAIVVYEGFVKYHKDVEQVKILATYIDNN